MYDIYNKKEVQNEVTVRQQPKVVENNIKNNTNSMAKKHRGLKQGKNQKAGNKKTSYPFMKKLTAVGKTLWPVFVPVLQELVQQLVSLIS